MDDEREIMRYPADDGSLYAVELVPPEGDDYRAHYGVDLVRASTDGYGLEHTQRLRLGAYPSWGAAEEHQREVESALEKDGIDGLGEDARRIAQMPYLDGQYLAMVFPADGSTGDSAKVHLLYLSGEQVTTALIANGRTEDMETLCDQLDRAWAEDGNEGLLQTAQREAEMRGRIEPGTALFEQGESTVRHVDGSGTAHWFAIVENREPQSEPYELRYFRSLETTDGSQHSDSYPVMPLSDDDRRSVWPLPSLEMYLQRGDLYMAQQLAHDVADHHGQAFPDPLDLPALNPEPEYYFGYGVGPNNEPSLEAVKTWMHGSERRFDTFTIAEYGMWDEAQPTERELETTLKTQGLEAAMNQAERMAVAGGYLDPERTDGRVFFEDDAPPDPFITERTRAMEREMQHDDVPQDSEHTIDDSSHNPTVYRDFVAEAAREREANAALEGTAWFEATFEKSDTELLSPVNDTVNYAVVIQETDPWTRELMVEKYWREPNGYLGLQSVTLDIWDSDDEKGREQANQAREALLDVYDKRGLAAMMHKAELTAMRNDWLDGDRADLRLFTEGPPDRFETLAQQLQGEPNPFRNIDEAEHSDDLVIQPGVENPYWRLDTLPVNDPSGEALGHALHIVIYPDIEHDPETIGSPAMSEETPFKLLEMAHFTTTEAADAFAKEFSGYLMPGVLEGPELAVEVASLEGFPTEWKTLEGDDLKAYHTDQLTLTKELSDWHPYNPNAERDARIAAEGLYYDPIQQFMERDESQAQSDTPTLEL